MALSISLLALLWRLIGRSENGLYQIALGSMILVQLAIHTRHLRNLALFRAINDTDEVRGRIEYARPLLLRMSSFECLAFSGLYFLLFILLQSWLVLGGAIGCLSLAIKHRKLASKKASPAPSLAAPPKATDAEPR